MLKISNIFFAVFYSLSLLRFGVGTGQETVYRQTYWSSLQWGDGSDERTIRTVRGDSTDKGEFVVSGGVSD